MGDDGKGAPALDFARVVLHAHLGGCPEKGRDYIEPLAELRLRLKFAQD